MDDASSPPVLSPAAEKFLRLHLCPQIGPVRFGRLLREFGSIDAVLGASAGRLAAVESFSPRLADQTARHLAQADVAVEVQAAARRGVRILCLEDDEYPLALKRIEDPTPCLYLRGGFVPQDTLALAIVGARSCSRYGAEQAERFGALVAGAGMTVVSGMARGIDTYAHRGALSVGGRTIAVLGCGLAHLYPPDAFELAETIAAHGAVVSELPMNIAPDPKNFPPRNRLIAGLSLGVLVVEAARRSGALITARLASEYNREVFAVPGRVDTLSAEGCNTLIKTGAAKLVAHLPDLLEELGEAGAALMPPPPERSAEAAPIPAADDFERQILDALGQEPLGIEDLCGQVGAPPARVASALTLLQLKGLLRRGRGDLFERV